MSPMFNDPFGGIAVGIAWYFLRAAKHCDGARVITRPRVRTVTPLFVVSDLQRSIDFYCEKLGFVDPHVHGDRRSATMTPR